MVAHACDPSIRKVEAGGPRTQGNPGLHKTLFQKRGEGERKKKPELPVALFWALLATSKCIQTPHRQDRGGTGDPAPPSSAPPPASQSRPVSPEPVRSKPGRAGGHRRLRLFPAGKISNAGRSTLRTSRPAREDKEALCPVLCPRLKPRGPPKTFSLWTQRVRLNSEEVARTPLAVRDAARVRGLGKAASGSRHYIVPEGSRCVCGGGGASSPQVPCVGPRAGSFTVVWSDGMSRKVSVLGASEETAAACLSGTWVFW